eukprot:tig00020572_g11542.t1
MESRFEFFNNARYADVELVVGERRYFLGSEILRRASFFDALLSDRWRPGRPPAPLAIGSPQPVEISAPADPEAFEAFLWALYMYRDGEALSGPPSFKYKDVQSALSFFRACCEYGWEEGLRSAVAFVQREAKPADADRIAECAAATGREELAALSRDKLPFARPFFVGKLLEEHVAKRRCFGLVVLGRLEFSK